MLKAIRNSPRASAAILAGLLLVAALAGHPLGSRPAPPPAPAPAPPEPTQAPQPTSPQTPSPTEPPPTSTPTPTITPTWTPTAGLVGPEYLEGHNPLTGLPVAGLTPLFRVPLLG